MPYQRRRPPRGETPENVKHLFSALLVAVTLVAVGCSAKTTLDELRAQNRVGLTRLAPGMSRNEVLEILGSTTASDDVFVGPTVIDWKKLTVTNPYRSESFEGAGGRRVEIIYYLTDIKRADNAISDDELTPVLLVDGAVVGWGWTAVNDGVQKYELRIR